MKINPTILDIAAAAGVSKSTVSRVLGNSGPVSAESRARVEQAVRALGYRPNAIAKAMKTNRTGTLAFLLCGGYVSLIADPFYAHVIDGVIRCANKLGWDLMLSAVGPGEGTMDSHLLQKKVDGVILASFAPSDTIEAFRSRDIPIVLLNYYINDPSLCCVTMDDYRSVGEEMEFLFARGHRRIAFIAGPTTSFSHAERLRAYRDRLAEHGLLYDERLVRTDDVGTGSKLVERGRQMMQSLLDEAIAFSAVLVVNDYMAAGALQALRAAGRRVPEDVAIMGYDDLTCASFLEPPLTTYAVDAEALGSEAVTHLVRIMEGDKTVPHIVIPGRGVVVRNSV